MSINVPQPVMDVLARSTVVGDSLALPPEQLDRRLYEAVNKVLVAGGGKWNRKSGAHVFGAPAADFVEGILLTGRYSDEKKDFNAFYTPADLAALVIQRADIRQGMRVLEPSAGEGALARPVALLVSDVVCVDVRPTTFLVEWDRAALEAHEGDFLALTFADLGTFDRVVMNPPFAKRQAEAHVLHAFSFLKPGGRLVAIMPVSVTFRDDRIGSEFRAFLAHHSAVVERLPEGAFRSSGTAVSTVMIIVDAPAAEKASAS